jgi:hypothetical protein
MIQQLRERVDTWDNMKIKSFCTIKEMVSKLKRLFTESEIIFGAYTSDMILITRISREFKKLNLQRLNDPMKKWASDLNKAFPKEDVQLAKKTHDKRMIIPGQKGNANQNHV